MSRILKWAGVGVGALFGALLLCVAGVYLASEVMLDRAYTKKPDAIRVTGSQAAIGEGRHLVAVIGCAGCHGVDLTGAKIDVPGSTVYAPNLTLLGKQSDVDLDRILRNGQMPDGTSVVVMPSRAYASLTQAESASIIAYLRSLKPHGAPTPDLRFGLMVRAGIVFGKFDSEMGALAKTKPPIVLGPRYERGRHLAQVVCAGCHGSDLAGQPDDPVLPTPDLMIAGAYDRQQFHTLMHTGKTLSGLKSEMSDAARQYFTNFSDDEVDAIYDYLASRTTALTARAGSPDAPR